MFKHPLIRINADFPNTIYLLAFDRQIIEKNLEEQPGISGKDFLDKIVQIHFDIPFTRQNKIAKFLFTELERILSTLPKSFEKYFDQTYWANIYHSGFKTFFKNIRDVKRFISSLEFNISLMYKGESMEVNPIDFIVIESIRVFVPEFYNFIKFKKALFTDTSSSYITGYNGKEQARQKRKEAIEQNFNKLNDDIKRNLEELIFRLFPQVMGIFGNTYYGHEWQPKWSKDLKVCLNSYFDAYFTLIPGGDEEELSQFEIDKILDSLTDAYKLEKILLGYLNNSKIHKV